MATYYYNPYSGETPASQWSQHLQNQAYLKDALDSRGQLANDFSRIISRQTNELGETIQRASREQALAIQESTNAISGSLESGFELLSEHLQEISFAVGDLRSELNEMASVLDWKLSLLVEGQTITNLLLGNVAVLLRIPDIQKERQYNIERGIHFLKNAIFDNDFFDDALKYLLKSETIESTDYFALHRIGLIYLYSPKHCDLNKAEEYFRKAAKYAVAETNSGAHVTTNYLSGDLDNHLSEQTPAIDSVKLQAAESYLFAGRSCYAQGRFGDAAFCAEKGFGLVPQMAEAGFIQAKALAANNDEPQAAKVLERVIETNRFFSTKAASDLDLAPKPAIQSLFKKLQNEATEKASQVLQNCKKEIIEGSNAVDYLNTIEKLVKQNTYLHSKKALDLFNKVRKWVFIEPNKNSVQSNQLNELAHILASVNNLEYFKRGLNFFPVNHSFVDPIVEKP